MTTNDPRNAAPSRSRTTLSGRLHTWILFGTLAVVVIAGGLSARPSRGGDPVRTPTDRSEVLQSVARLGGDPREAQRKALGRQLAERPDDLRSASTLARLDIQLARERSDPRYLGYAQGALAPWWELPSPPAEVLVLRATIRQSLHDFDGALADLDQDLALRPDDAQAWITRAVVLTVRGRYDEARASCRALFDLVPTLDRIVCEASVDAVTGAAGRAYAALEAGLAGKELRSPDETEWAMSTLGEVAVRLGRGADAERWFRAALATAADDPYVLAAYADMLLDAGRPRDAATLVAGRVDNDGLLLRLALAENAAFTSLAAEHTALLASRFDAIRLRGDTVHRREEARFELALRGDAHAALALARANFDIQREPWDVRILLEAARAAGDRGAAAPALAFLTEHGLEDPHIAKIAAELRGAP